MTLFRIATWVTSCALGMGGCSLLMSQPPPTAAPLRFGSECSDSYLPVVGDIYLATNTGGVALLAFAAAAIQRQNASQEIVPSWDPGRRSDSAVPELVTIGMVSTIATVALIRSAMYGAGSADACAKARLPLLYPGPLTGPGPALAPPP